MPSDTLPTLLSKLRTAADDGDRGRARSVVEDIRDEVERVRPEERAQLTRAVEARDSVGLDDAHGTVDAYAKQLAAIDVARAGTVTVGTLFASGVPDAGAAQVQSTASELTEQEEELSTLAEEAGPALDDVELDPTVVATAVDTPSRPRPKGTRFDVVGHAANVGDAVATGVTLAVESTLPASPSSRSVGSLDPDARADGSFTVEAASSGEVDVQVTVTSENAGEDAVTATVEVLDKAGGIDAAADSLAQVQASLPDLDLSKQLRSSLRSKLTAAEGKLEDAARFADQGKAEEADNMLDAASNVLGAALNQIRGKQRGQGNGTGSDAPLRLLAGSIEGVIDDIATAREAEL